MRITFSILFLLLNTLYAKEPFSIETMLEYLNEENPYVYAAFAKEYINKEKVNYYLGDFDTKLSSKYEKKQYPLSEANFFDVTLQKPLENGVEFVAGYRDVQGTQEYNNIKTGEKGETRVGVNIPLFSVMHNISKRKRDLYSAGLESKKFHFVSKDNIRKLYFTIISDYHKLLYSKEIRELTRELLDTAEKREEIIKKRVKVGDLADIDLLEANQQVLNRQQRFVLANNEYTNTLVNFLNYLNLSQESFRQTYTIPSMHKHTKKSMNLEEGLELALKNRPDLEMLDFDIKKVKLDQEQTQLLKYPNLNLSLYGVNDLEYDNGFKVSLSMDFPIQRRKYEGQYAENKYRLKNIENDKKQKIMMIKTTLNKIINSLKNLELNVKTSEQEIVLVEKLEVAEHKKYRLGLSNLFIVNQREIYTLEIKKKLLGYKLQQLLLQEQLNREIGITHKDFRS